MWRPGINLGENLILILFSFDDSRTQNVGATSNGFWLSSEGKSEAGEGRE